jgi:hypothetical protein
MTGEPHDSDAHPEPVGPEPVVPDAVSSSPAAGRPGYSTAEKVIGAAAAYTHPLGSSVVASAMLSREDDPVRRNQLNTLRRGAMTWWAVSAGVGLIAVIIVLIAVSHSGGAGASCSGGPDKFDVMGTTYQSTDNRNWTVTYPCRNGGSETIPIARRKVPGIGGG